MSKAAPSEEQLQRLHTMGEINFTKIIQVTKQTGKQKTSPIGEGINIYRLLQHIIYNIQFSAKIYETCKETRKPEPTQEKKQVTEAAFERKHMLNLGNKDFKAVTIKVSRKLKDTMLKEVKEHMMIVFRQIENITKEIKMKQMES